MEGINLKKYLIFSQGIFIAICIAIIVVVNIQNDYPSTMVNVLAIIGVMVALFQVYIQRKIKIDGD